MTGKRVRVTIQEIRQPELDAVPGGPQRRRSA